MGWIIPREHRHALLRTRHHGNRFSKFAVRYKKYSEEPTYLLP
jgi:hypothetical protein